MSVYKLLLLGLLAVCSAAALSRELVTDVDAHLIKRQALSPPKNACTDGDVQLVTDPQEFMWRCTSEGKWLLYRLNLALGIIKDQPGCSCKEVKEALSGPRRLRPVQSGVYWLTLGEGCSSGLQKRAVKVYCDMTTDGGGWTLVWKNSFWDNLPLNEDMFYFSKYYRPCEDYSGDWCNIPNKGRCNKTCCPPTTEMMIAAYHNRSTVYAYKGHINNNIDWDWTGGRLLYPTKIVDHCKWNNVAVPAPGNHESRDLGLSFDKNSPDNPYQSCDTIGASYANPWDCRWHDCGLPIHISNVSHSTQMTLAIYVR